MDNLKKILMLFLSLKLLSCSEVKENKDEYSTDNPVRTMNILNKDTKKSIAEKYDSINNKKTVLDYFSYRLDCIIKKNCPEFNELKIVLIDYDIALHTKEDAFNLFLKKLDENQDCLIKIAEFENLYSIIEEEVKDIIENPVDQSSYEYRFIKGKWNPFFNQGGLKVGEGYRIPTKLVELENSNKPNENSITENKNSNQIYISTNEDAIPKLPIETTFDNPPFKIPLREMPNAYSKPIYDCPIESDVTVLEFTNEDYWLVEVNNHRGYISNGWLKYQLK